jgi:tetratricopeptide (TPR) repeat protein
MKKQFRMIALLVLSAGLTVAQTSKRTTAINALRDFQTYGEADALKKAKDNIDAAALHEETGKEAKTWKVRGDVYLTAYEHAKKVEDDKQKDVKDANKKSMVSYSNTPIADLEVAYVSYAKVKQFDKKNIYTEEITPKLVAISAHFDNKGRADYNSKKAAEAATSFEKAYEISLLFGKADTSVLNYVAMSYKASGNYPKAKETYQKLVDMGYGKGATVSILANMLLNEKDSAGAGVIIRKGRQQYPSDYNLLTAETNLFLMAKKNKEALGNLKTAIEKNPNDPQLNMVLGNLYDNLANPKDDKGLDMTPPKEADEYLTQSEFYYKKVIELKPDYFDALYNLGALYNNQGVKLSNKANTIKEAAKYAQESKKADDVFKKAIPYLEKAHEVNPKDKTTMLSLKQLYFKTEQTEKYDKIVAELKAN